MARFLQVYALLRHPVYPWGVSLPLTFLYERNRDSVHWSGIPCPTESKATSYKMHAVFMSFVLRCGALKINSSKQRADASNLVRIRISTAAEQMWSVWVPFRCGCHPT